MPDTRSISRQVELLHAYHVALWVEIQNQLDTLRRSQAEIAALRQLQSPYDAQGTMLHGAEMLEQHVAALKGRARGLTTTIEELEVTVQRLVNVLKASPPAGSDDA